MIAAIMLVTTQTAPVPSYEPNPPISAMRRVKDAELQKIVPDARVMQGIPGHVEMQLFFADGRYEQYRQFPVETGRWFIKNDMICRTVPRELCHELWQDRRGRFYYVAEEGTLRRPWRITFTPKAKLPHREPDKFSGKRP